MKATRSRHGWVHMFITHRPTVTLQLHNFDLFRTWRTSSFCTVARQLARFRKLTRRIARSPGDSWPSCTFLVPAVLEKKPLNGCSSSSLPNAFVYLTCRYNCLSAFPNNIIYNLIKITDYQCMALTFRSDATVSFCSFWVTFERLCSNAETTWTCKYTTTRNSYNLYLTQTQNVAYKYKNISGACSYI